MNEITPLHELRTLTQELQSLTLAVKSGTFNGREYEVITSKVGEHREKIEAICAKCIGRPQLSSDLRAYSTELHTVKTLLPPLKVTSDKVTNAIHMKIFAISSKLSEAQIINKMSLAFELSEAEIRELLPEDSSKGFFVDIAQVCVDLASKRLAQSKPLDFKEVSAIHDALFDPTIKKFSDKGIELNHHVQPHPAYVFASLHALLTSVEDFDSCDQIQEQVNKYLQEKPPVGTLDRFFAQTKPTQARLIGILKGKASEGDEPSIAFLKDLDEYQAKLKIFKDGLKGLPLVNARTMQEDSVNINQTFFLNVKGDSHWVFKPASENEKGGEIMQAECTASKLNYHGQFPIPLTVALVIKDWVGSAQMFVQDSQKIAQIETANIPVESDQLHKLAIFDLLFTNSDRNSANFLFQTSSHSASVVGIDHDSCLMFKEIKALKLEYLQIPALKQPLKPEMAVLFSKEAIATYKQIMAENDVPDLQLEWLDTVAEELNAALVAKTPLRDVIISLQSQYEERFLN
ncbi:Conserved hypothetical protein [Candidatus Protochlamydia naegleriophila]|uniref:PI3K/PI4K catalytic domain-containing protein n=1 Tax=Candidatus Protochlamydia naegleriophila TaxID=389348 RepID=A0A0U5EUM3_9BACT|nr:hypothetical protein [Candidatus Protochlamydia naegleriophila]CUI17952.1 Conserved hypothetical protein [Candidatus Protochlamydia naegleriophila]